ncbi:hypothetical protein FQV27_12215 [Paracoccus aurantiacus]|uniref:DUF2497 domain-containing protein n=1 Tax=Paracoccus aurantiacus TaxID=2599412 RepID=A0A5C6S1N8_9RHOB|nr:hypothetical protein [Paracoccus aurantiacus]TXB68737.1 hypothetical protein FQV27_12215 [Paracoccus aurantiacus]
MSELAAQAIPPQIGDVLESIRRLISQDGAVPDFATPIRRTDASGKDRSALMLGPQAEKLRTVIERELEGVAFADDRLILRRADMQHDGDDSVAASSDSNHADPQLPDEAALPDSHACRQTDTTPIPHSQENDMMLAEVSRTTPHLDAAIARVEGFDLFAAEGPEEEEDQMAGGNALRNLVRDVIRQELQGEMGDRISRNLRRAIRQEVTAAISAGLKGA